MDRMLKRHMPPPLPVQRSKGLERSGDFLEEGWYTPSECLCSPPLNTSLHCGTFEKCFIKASPRQRVRVIHWEVKCVGVGSHLAPEPPFLRPGHVTSSLYAVEVNRSTLWATPAPPSRQDPLWNIGHKPRGEGTDAAAFSNTEVSMLIPHSSISHAALPPQVTPRLCNPGVIWNCLPPGQSASWPRTPAIPSHPWNTATFTRCLGLWAQMNLQSLFFLLVLFTEQK